MTPVTVSDLACAPLAALAWSASIIVTLVLVAIVKIIPALILLLFLTLACWWSAEVTAWGLILGAGGVYVAFMYLVLEGRRTERQKRFKDALSRLEKALGPSGMDALRTMSRRDLRQFAEEALIREAGEALELLRRRNEEEFCAAEEKLDRRCTFLYFNYGLADLFASGYLLKAENRLKGAK